MSFSVGASVLAFSPAHSWVFAEVNSWGDKEGGKVTPVDAKAHGGQFVVKTADKIYPCPADACDGAEEQHDLLSLTLLLDGTILNSLRNRYMKDYIYTNIGAIVVALNPFNFKIPWYTDDNMPKYLAEGERIERNLPHSWAQAHNTYNEMREMCSNQSILVSGESGAGKTEASKIVLKYLGHISCQQGTDEQKKRGLEVGAKLAATGPPLEAFGNAKTITKYLLEKSRIVTAQKGERCYHGLYLVARGADNKKFRTDNDKEFKILCAGNTLNNKEFDTAAEYKEVCDAMVHIGIARETVMSMWAVVAGVLHLGNVQFNSEGEGSQPSAETKERISFTAGLWQVDAEALEKELLTTTLNISGQLITKMLNPVAAADAKEALAKGLYDNQFGWLIEQCNAMLTVSDCSSWIGLLDIFGFEDFEINSFEQVCINLTNETLQGHYNEYIFQKDLDECRAEGIDMTSVEFPDNTPCIEMITAKGGVMSLLDEECSLGKGTDMSFLEKMTAACKPNPFFVRKQLQKTSFTVRHYAGDVTYEVANFLDKNRDTLKDAFKLLMRNSGDSHIKILLPEPSDARRHTVGAFFKNQLKELMDVLNATNPHWIRCVKPHPAKKPLMFDGISTTNQLSSSGVLGTVRIRKAGYPVRIKHADFIARYNVMGKEIEAILKFAKIESLSQIGTKRVFIKSDAYIKLEAAKKEALQDFARTIQGFFVTAQLTNTFRARQREANKSFIEEVRVSARRLLEFQVRADERRKSFLKSVLVAKTDATKKYEVKLKEMMEEFYAFQRQQNRIEYEKRKRENELMAEKERKEAAKREAREKLEKQRREEERELAELRAKAESARRERHEQELAMAMSLQSQTEANLVQQAGKIFRKRQDRQIDSRVKTEAARLRKLEHERMLLRTKHQALVETETAAVRGQIAKSQTLIQQRQNREISKLQIESRRREVADRLHDEEDRRERFTRLRIAMSDAKHAFIEEQKKQLQKDAQEKMRLEIQELADHERYVERLHQRAAREEYKDLTQTRQGLEKAEKFIDNFRRRAEREDAAKRQAHEQFAEREIKRDSDTARLRQHVDSIKTNVATLGTTAFKPPASPKPEPKPQHVDPRRRAVERLHELVSPETEALYERLRKESELEIMKYALTVPPKKPLQDLPWRR